MLDVEDWPLSKRLYYYHHLAALRQHDHDAMEADADAELETAEAAAGDAAGLPGVRSPSPTGDANDPVAMDSVHPALRKYDTVVTTGGGDD